MSTRQSTRQATKNESIPATVIDPPKKTGKKNSASAIIVPDVTASPVLSPTPIVPDVTTSAFTSPPISADIVTASAFTSPAPIVPDVTASPVLSPAPIVPAVTASASIVPPEVITIPADIVTQTGKTKIVTTTCKFGNITPIDALTAQPKLLTASDFTGIIKKPIIEVANNDKLSSDLYTTYPIKILKDVNYSTITYAKLIEDHTGATLKDANKATKLFNYKSKEIVYNNFNKVIGDTRNNMASATKGIKFKFPFCKLYDKDNALIVNDKNANYNINLIIFQIVTAIGDYFHDQLKKSSVARTTDGDIHLINVLHDRIDDNSSYALPTGGRKIYTKKYKTNFKTKKYNKNILKSKKYKLNNKTKKMKGGVDPPWNASSQTSSQGSSLYPPLSQSSNNLVLKLRDPVSNQASNNLVLKLRDPDSTQISTASEMAIFTIFENLFQDLVVSLSFDKYDNYSEYISSCFDLIKLINDIYVLENPNYETTYDNLEEAHGDNIIVFYKKIMIRNVNELFLNERNAGLSTFGDFISILQSDLFYNNFLKILLKTNRIRCASGNESYKGGFRNQSGGNLTADITALFGEWKSGALSTRKSKNTVNTSNKYLQAITIQVFENLGLITVTDSDAAPGFDCALTPFADAFNETTNSVCNFNDGTHGSKTHPSKRILAEIIKTYFPICKPDFNFKFNADITEFAIVQLMQQLSNEHLCIYDTTLLVKQNKKSFIISNAATTLSKMHNTYYTDKMSNSIAENPAETVNVIDDEAAAETDDATEETGDDDETVGGLARKLVLSALPSYMDAAGANHLDVGSYTIEDSIYSNFKSNPNIEYGNMDITIYGDNGLDELVDTDNNFKWIVKIDQFKQTSCSSDAALTGTKKQVTTVNLQFDIHNRSVMTINKKKFTCDLNADTRLLLNKGVNELNGVNLGSIRYVMSLNILKFYNKELNIPANADTSPKTPINLLFKYNPLFRYPFENFHYSFEKTLGDLGQILNALAKNGGYAFNDESTNTIVYGKKVYQFVNGSAPRLIAHHDYTAMVISQICILLGYYTYEDITDADNNTELISTLININTESDQKNIYTMAADHSLGFMAYGTHHLLTIPVSDVVHQHHGTYNLILDNILSEIDKSVTHEYKYSTLDKKLKIILDSISELTNIMPDDLKNATLDDKINFITNIFDEIKNKSHATDIDDAVNSIYGDTDTESISSQDSSQGVSQDTVSSTSTSSTNSNQSRKRSRRSRHDKTAKIIDSP